MEEILGLPGSITSHLILDVMNLKCFSPATFSYAGTELDQAGTCAFQFVLWLFSF